MIAALAVILMALLAAAAPAAAAPIPLDPLSKPPPAFEGAPATPRGVDSPEPPRHPFMAPNGRSNIHADAYQTDAYRTPGPLGRGTTVTSTLQGADCASVTFDSRGRIVTICVGVVAPTLQLLDPVTLRSIASMTLPPRDPAGLAGLFSDFSGGGYFYLDERDRAVFATNDRRLRVVAVRGDSLVTERDYDLTGAVAAGDKIYSALPDFSGRIWFVSARGVVGTVDPATGTVRAMATGETIANSFAVDETGGVYVVTNAALYRFDAGASGAPAITWRERYRNSGIAKPGQVGAGSGTTPTVMAGGRVAITDNADPMNVVVLRRAPAVRGSRLVCEQPVFSKGASASDNSLIAARNSLVVENNYGYSGPAATMNGKTTTPGIERVDVRRGGRGCRTVWRSSEVSPTVVPKLSLATGLIYAYAKPARADRTDAWYLSALDFCTGQTRFRRLAGTGFGYNNNYAPITLGPDGAAYVGVLGGLVRFADSVSPTGPPRGAPRGCAPRPRLVLRARRVTVRGAGSSRPPGRCGLRARVAGADRALVRRVRLRAGRRAATDRRAPFVRTLQSRARLVRAFVRLRDGRAVRLRARVRRCR